jgi:hypothetical protein
MNADASGITNMTMNPDWTLSPLEDRRTLCFATILPRLVPVI